MSLNPDPPSAPGPVPQPPPAAAPPPPPPPPPGYAPPYYAYPPQWTGGTDPRAAAGRAGILMIVLGAIALLLAGCVGVSAALIPTMRDNPQISTMLSEIERGGFSAATLMTINAIVTGLIGLSFVVVGVLVRRGTAGPVITGIVLTSLVLALQALGTVVMAVTGQTGTAACNLLVIAPLVVLLVMLIQAARNIRSVSAMQTSYQPQAMGSPYGWPPQAYPPSYGYGYGYGYGAQAPPPPRPPIEPMEPREHI